LQNIHLNTYLQILLHTEASAEAEAQCAVLESLGLVDGVVTEDSDVFLFGARKVYRNIFDQKKYAEKYYMANIESDFGLDRDKLIYLAMLLGSDYTPGNYICSKLFPVESFFFYSIKIIYILLHDYA
jgi:5'-3' exonuclease